MRVLILCYITNIVALVADPVLLMLSVPLPSNSSMCISAIVVIIMISSTFMINCQCCVVS